MHFPSRAGSKRLCATCRGAPELGWWTEPRRPGTSRAWFGAALALMLAAASCAYETGSVEVPDADTRRFALEVYPILLADCGFPACHGSGERPLSVYGPGRTRLDPELDAYAPATAEELALSYTRARSMLVDPEGPRRAPLLRKPLAVEAGGAAHEGDDPWGNPVFETKRDPRFEALFFWAIGEGAPR